MLFLCVCFFNTQTYLDAVLVEFQSNDGILVFLCQKQKNEKKNDFSGMLIFVASRTFCSFNDT